jgi:hypothetical protein
MRTTVDISDELFRQAKARAALEGLRLRDLIERGLRLALAEQGYGAPGRVTFPLLRSLQPGVLTTEAVRTAEEDAARQEDADRAGPV